MKDPFIESQWQELCDHLERVAAHLCVQGDDVAEFRQQIPPDRYPDLLDRVRQATRFANRWREEILDHDQIEESIDEAGRESFPASDPPSFSHSHA